MVTDFSARVLSKKMDLKCSTKQATMNLLVEVTPPRNWIILQKQYVMLLMGDLNDHVVRTCSLYWLGLGLQPLS